MKTLCSTLLVLSALAIPVHAGTLLTPGTSSCAPDFSSCTLFEGQTVALPGFAIAGDVIVYEPWQPIVSDVFHIFNDVFDSGGGTGLGDMAILYAADLGNLPDPSTYSVNAVSVTENFGNGVGLIETDYNGNGTIYQLFTPDVGAPEPSTAALMGAGVALAIWRRRRLAHRA
jgi:hypothetical protein